MRKIIIASLVFSLWGCQSGTKGKDEAKEQMKLAADSLEMLDDDIEEIGDAPDGEETLKEEVNEASEDVKKEAKTSAKDEKPQGTVYRSDGFHPGITSEWVQVQYNEAHNKVLNIWFWDANDKTPQKMIIINQEFSEGEISGFTGDVAFASEPNEKYGLGIVEDRFVLNLGDNMQEFEIE